MDSLKTLCALLYQHHGQKVILLIDEYDVPLDKAFLHGYYPEMVSFCAACWATRSDQRFLPVAVLTGCLRVSRNIFTGLNNLEVNSIWTRIEHFGTDAEVQKLLADLRTFFPLRNKGLVRQLPLWRSGNLLSLGRDQLRPRNCWPSQRIRKITGSTPAKNDMVRRFVDKADKST